MIPSGWLMSRKNDADPYRLLRPGPLDVAGAVIWLRHETYGAFEADGDIGRYLIARRLLWCQWLFRGQYRERGGVE